MSPVTLSLIICGAVCLLTWIPSLFTGDSSWVDRMWSIIPVVYAWVFAGLAGLSDARLNIMAILITLWGIRLTFNFARRGGYSGYEDYRWAVLRAKMKPWQYQLFNIFFIVIFQNLLLMAIVFPMWTVSQNPSAGLGVGFDILVVLFVLALIGETVADQQQWNFQKRKYAAIAAGQTPESRFCQSGLFKVSRHPNYFFELAQWWIVFLMGVVAAGSLWQWTGVGVLVLTGLFVGSTRFTEQITLSKYSEYASYQKRVSAVIPFFPRKSEVTSATA